MALVGVPEAVAPASLTPVSTLERRRTLFYLSKTAQFSKVQDLTFPQIAFFLRQLT